MIMIWVKCCVGRREEVTVMGRWKLPTCPKSGARRLLLSGVVACWKRHRARVIMSLHISTRQRYHQHRQSRSLNEKAADAVVAVPQSPSQLMVCPDEGMSSHLKRSRLKPFMEMGCCSTLT